MNQSIKNDVISNKIKRTTITSKTCYKENNKMHSIKIKRIYEAPTANDGYRILVDRLWPRGISKEHAKIDEWIKEIAPSTELRKWFNHQPELFPEFSKKYKSELQQQKAALQHILDIAKKQSVCLLYGAKDEHYNQAVVLKSILDSLEQLLSLRTEKYG